MRIKIIIKIILLIAASALIIKWLMSLIYATPELNTLYNKFLEPVMKY